MEDAKPSWLLDTLTSEASRLAARIATADGKTLGVAHLPHLSFYELVETLIQRGMSLEVIADMLGMRKGGLHGKHKRALEQCRERHVPALFQIAQVIFERHARVRNRARPEAAPGRRGEVGEISEFELDEALPHLRFEVMRAALRELVRRRLISERGEVGQRTFRWTGPLETMKGERVDARQVWVTLLDTGPSSEEALAERLGLHDPQMREELRAALQTLGEEGHVFKRSSDDGDRYACADCNLSADEPTHRYGALLHHLLAFFAAMNAAFDSDRRRTDASGRRVEGGSTYVIEVHPDNPLRDEVEGVLARIAGDLTDLRHRVQAAEAELNPTGEGTERWCLYAGQVRLTRGR